MIDKLQKKLEFASFEDMERGIGISIPPSLSEVVDKVNEIIDVVNSIEERINMISE